MSRAWLYRRLAYPAYHAIRRDGMGRAIRQLAGTERAEPAALAAHRQERLSRLLRFACAYVPYYRQWFREQGKVPDYYAQPGRLAELPVLTKAIVRQQGDGLAAEAAGGRRSYANSTSGSTGEPLRFRTDFGAHVLRLADELRGKRWAGFRLGEREVALWGAPMDVGRARRLRGRLHGAVSGHRLLSSFELNAGRMDEYIVSLSRFRPRLLVAYPSALEVLANHCLERGARLDSLGIDVICSAETLWEPQRALFERVFGRGVFNRYGCREVGAIAHECAAHAGLHVSADRLLLEIVDSAGRPCRAGEWGELLVTELASYAMPLIRYRIGDRAAWAGEGDCSCGLRLPRLVGVEGRSMDAVRGPDGRRVGGTFWTLLLRSRPGFKQFQVRQDASGAVTVRYVPAGALEPGVLEHYARKIREQLGEAVAVSFEAVEAIPPASSGKHRLISSAYEPLAQAAE